ncbi:MAG TPA: hypothetical protein VMY88_00460 [Acidimicrobiales bacterium]|nr:hypothetical protein [Acidimicrobiales bacterium]
MRRSGSLVVLLLSLTLAWAAGEPAQARSGQTDGTVGIRLIDAPQNRADDPRARLYIVDHLAPGSSINRRVEVANHTDAPQHVELYAAAASIDDGGFRFGEAREANELAGWTRVAPGTLDLQPEEKGTATVTIDVPKDAREGERYGVVWAEMQAVASEDQAIGAINRVGVRMYLSVGVGGEPATDFEITDIEGRRDEDGNPVVAAIVRNIGGRAVDLSGELRLSNGPGGLSAGPVPAEAGTTIAKGQSGPVLFILDPALPPGPWVAQIKMRSGNTSREASGTVTFPDERGGVTEGELKDAGKMVPLIAGGIVGVLLLSWFFFWFFVRRRKKNRDEEDAT